MHHATLFFVLLFLPNTTLSDWQNADAPNLHRLMASGAIALMNCRTSEIDTITPDGGIQSILAGARTSAAPSLPSTPSAPLPSNLIESLKAQGVSVDLVDRQHRYLARPAKSQFVLLTISSDPKAADREVGYWADENQRRQGELMMVSPNPTKPEYRALKQLTPVLLWGPDVSPGFLSSASTRTKGLIVNTDIAVTVASYFKIDLVGPSYGQPIITVPASDESPVAVLSRHEARSVEQTKLIRYLPYVAAAIALLVVISMTFVASGLKFGERIALIAITIPWMMLMTGLPWLPIVLGVLLALIILFTRLGKRVVLQVLLTFGFWISLDCALSSGRMFGSSMLGYSPIEGARYYGIGNETMGLYIGFLVMVLSSITGRSARLLQSIFWISAGLLLSLPMCGAKAGGLIVCAVCLATALSTISGRRLADPVTVGSIAIAVFGAVALLMITAHFGPHTHVTGAMEQAKKSGGSAYAQIIARKAGMDLHLVFHSVWIWVLLTSFAGRWFYARRNGSASTDALASTGTTAIVTCLLFNDAGVVAAALCSLMVWGAEVSDVRLILANPQTKKLSLGQPNRL